MVAVSISAKNQLDTSIRFDRTLTSDRQAQTYRHRAAPVSRRVGKKSYWAIKPILSQEFNESKLKILFLNKIVSQIKNRSSADRCKRLVSDVFIEEMTKVQQVWLSRLQLQIISRECTMRPTDTAACPRYPTAADTAPSVRCTVTFDPRSSRHSRLMLQQTLAHSRDCMCMYTLKLTMR